ncbi:MAG: hypothetical protein AB2806_13565 [Candidatus Thiodiazotropha sp.]
MPNGITRKHLHIPILWCVISVIIGFSTTPAVTTGQEGNSGMTPATLDKLTTDANLIFIGTVIGPDTASAKGAFETRVESALKTPAQFGRLDGTIVTLFKQPSTGLAADDRYVFFTKTQRLGKRLILQEIGRDQAAAAESLANTIKLVDQRTERSQLTERLKAADVVIAGKVTKIERDRPKPTVPVSEHEPQWMRATIQVEEVLRGSIKEQQLVLIYPGTMDIAWVGVPRPAEGQRAVWVLTADPDLKGYKAIDPLDVQSPQKRDEIRNMIMKIR